MRDAAERQLDAAAGAVVVDEHLAAAQRPRHPHLPGAVAGPDAGDQAVLGAVGDLDRLRLAVEGDQHLHRAEDLLLRERMVGGHVVDQRRLHVVAAARRAVDEPAFGGDDQAVVARQPEIVLDHHLLPL